MQIKALEVFLKSVTIPESKPQIKTFLGIAKQPHYENVISNIYAFFFTDTEVHQFEGLFITSLIELINKKKGSSAIYEVHAGTMAETEVSTDNGGRIDLLLQNDELAIIIENKIYHYLHNDLQDYWDSVKGGSKIGVVLSLQNISNVGHPDFVNITHYELLSTVFNKLGNYLLKIDAKFLVFLKDFYQNIINISNPMDTAALQFYYQHQEDIKQIIQIKENLYNHIKSEVEAACDILNRGLILGNKRGADWRYYSSPKNSELMFTLYFAELITDKRIHLIIELNDSMLSRKSEILNLDFGDAASLIKKDFESGNNKEWAHFVTFICVPTDNEILNLKDFIVDKLNTSGLLSIFEKIEMEILPNVDEIINTLNNSEE